MIQFNNDTPDRITWVTLVGIPAETEIIFTDHGLFADGSFRTNEDAITWLHNDFVPAGTVIVFEGDTSTVGEIDGDVLGLAISGDQIFVLTGSIAEPNIIFGLNNFQTGWQETATNSNNSGEPDIPANTKIALDHLDNQVYTGPTTGTREFLLDSITDNANWVGDNEVLQEYTGPNFVIVSDDPTASPTSTPTRSPVSGPVPTAPPTSSPTAVPTSAPTNVPTATPTRTLQPTPFATGEVRRAAAIGFHCFVPGMRVRGFAVAIES